MDNQTVADLDEKQVEDVDTSETTDTTETSVDTSTTEEENPYKKEFERVQKELEQKNGALKEERRLRKEAEKVVEMKTEDVEQKKYLTPEEAEQLFEKRLAKEKFESRLESFSTNPDEQKLIKHHYENSIVRTGDVATDLQMAVALANSHLVQQAKAVEHERTETEAIMARASHGGTYNRSGGKGADPATRAVSQFLKNIGASDAEKFIGK